jgi:hypothetical protein
MAGSVFSTAQNVFNLIDSDFYAFVIQHCGNDVADYFQLLGIRSAQSLLGIDDVFLSLRHDYIELDNSRKNLAFRCSDGTYVIKVGVEHDVSKLLMTLRHTLTNNPQVLIDDAKYDDLTLAPELLRRYPFLKRIIQYFAKASHHPDPTDKLFLHHLLENLFKNLPLTKSRHRYNEYVIDFALCLSILGGRNAYEFVRLNVPGALPNRTTIRTKLASEELLAHEGEFRYGDMQKYMLTANSNLAFCGEDATAVLRKIMYDVRSNSFVGFTPPLDENGLPLVKSFRTDSFEELSNWFEHEDVSHLLNLHMIQAIPTDDKTAYPFPLAAYGTNGKYTSVDVIRRWFTIFEQSLAQGIRIVGFSTDADPRYLLGMRLVSGFYATLSHDPKTHHPATFTVAIPASWSWFYLSNKQMFLCMQDAIHICTKLRNRLLSSSAMMMMGHASISTDHLLQVIETQSKFKHKLVRSDICPKDRQNFRSCEKLCAALDCLKDVNDSHGTFVYLTMIRCIIVAFIDRSTTTPERIYHAWLSVFLCRLWRTWLDLVPKHELDDRISRMSSISDYTKKKFTEKKSKHFFFITSPTYVCIELNAHHLTYLTLLVDDGRLPSEALKVYLFNSQSCESFFRLSRAISDTFSISVNFSVQQYLHRQEKITMLHSIKNQTDVSMSSMKFQFPQHHKSQRNSRSSATAPKKVTKRRVSELVRQAFNDAMKLLSPLGIDQVLKKANVYSITQVSQHIRNRFSRSTRTVDVALPVPIDEHLTQFNSDSDDTSTDEDVDDQSVELDSYEEEEEEEEEDKDDDGVNLLVDSDARAESKDDDDISSQNTTNNRLHTMKGVRDNINPDLKDSYFVVNIDGTKKYLHKSTAVWYLTDEKHKLSSDRMTRVMDNK